MKPNRELLLRIRNGDNLYKQFFAGKSYDHSESIFSVVTKTIDQLIGKIDADAPLPELQEFVRYRFVKTGWNTFLRDMEYVRPNNPENALHDSVNKEYYRQIGLAIGLDDFEAYVRKPKSNLQTISEEEKTSISRLKELSKCNDATIVAQTEDAFLRCFKKINSGKKKQLIKREVLRIFENLLQEVSAIGITDTEDRELIAEIIEDCLISYGFEDSDGLLDTYL